MRHFVLGTDIGGTFTDFVGTVQGDERLFVHKLLTTHEDPTAAVFAGLDRFESKRGITPDDTLTVVHATTLATNLILEAKGARVALVTTKGFRDILTMRRESRYDDYDLELAFPEPLVPRARRFEVTERTLATGQVAQEPGEAELREIARAIEKSGADAVAVCLLHAYANPQNERAVVFDQRAPSDRHLSRAKEFVRQNQKQKISAPIAGQRFEFGAVKQPVLQRLEFA